MEYFPAPIKTFLAALADRDSSLQLRTKHGGEKAGTWRIDVLGKKWMKIGWQPDLGFGLSIGEKENYGEGAAEIFFSPTRAAHRVIQLIAPQPGFKPMGLRALRELYGVSQDQMASRLKKGQAAISRQETRHASKMETISEYVRALGGKIEVRAVFPDGQIPIYQTARSAVRKTHGAGKSGRVARAKCRI